MYIYYYEDNWFYLFDGWSKEEQQRYLQGTSVGASSSQSPKKFIIYVCAGQSAFIYIYIYITDLCLGKRK